MSDVAPLRLVEEAEGPAAEGPESKIHVRQFSAPAGPPWDQARAARLEARLGAPLPLSELVYQLQRLEPWSPGRPAKFAAFYARSKDVGQSLEASLQVEGRVRTVRFVSAKEQSRQARGLLTLALGLGATAFVSLAVITMAIAVRSNTNERLEALEPALLGKMKVAKTLDRDRRQSRALEVAGLRGRALSDYLSDLAWASAAKAPGARIDAVHWDHGLMAVEAHGDASPFVESGREVTKVEKPLRPGLWLWGVAPAVRANPNRETAP